MTCTGIAAPPTRTTQPITPGKTVTIDENYIRESILAPNAEIVKGFPAAMPSFAGQLSEQEILGVIEFIKTLK